MTKTSRYQHALDALKLCGFTRADVKFSGGGDEGGVDEITLHRQDGTELDLFQTKAKVDDQDAAAIIRAEEQELQRCRDAILKAAGLDFEEMLSQPVDDEFGGFCGDSVQGQVTFDVHANTVTISHMAWVDQGDYDV